MIESNRQKSDDAGYEKHDISLNKIILYGVSGLVITIIVIVVLVDLFTAVREEIVYESVLRPESAELRELRAREIEELGSYKLLDANKGTYRIPIERAKKLMADEAYREQAEDRGQ